MPLINLEWLYATILLSLRLGPVMFMTPVMGTSYAPGVVKALLALGLSSLVVLGMGWSITIPSTVWGLMLPALAELMTGMLLAYGVQTAFGALSFAGRLLDTQMGLGMAGMIDPMSKQSSALFGVVLNLLAVAYVFAIDGHHMLLRGLVYSVEKLPLGSVWRDLTVATVSAQFGVVFSLGLAFLAPILMVLFFMEIGIALMARSMPQLNAFLVSIPAKIGIGLILLVALLPMSHGAFERWFASILYFWDGVLF